MPNWPHSPLHKLSEAGVYMVTAGTLYKKHYLSTPERLTLFHDMLLDTAHEFNWLLEAWSVLSNHYHFLGQSPEDPRILKTFISKLHTRSAIALNELDCTPGRRVWYQYWDSHITYEPSYLARLKYVHTNPVHHGLVHDARAYQWCSAAWFERTATPSFQKVLDTFKIDKLNVMDDY